MDGNISSSVFEVEMKFSESKWHDSKHPANYIKTLGIYSASHRGQLKDLKEGGELLRFMAAA